MCNAGGQFSPPTELEKSRYGFAVYSVIRLPMHESFDSFTHPHRWGFRVFPGKSLLGLTQTLRSWSSSHAFPNESLGPNLVGHSLASHWSFSVHVLLHKLFRKFIPNFAKAFLIDFSRYRYFCYTILNPPDSLTMIVNVFSAYFRIKRS